MKAVLTGIFWLISGLATAWAQSAPTFNPDMPAPVQPGSAAIAPKAPGLTGGEAPAARLSEADGEVKEEVGLNQEDPGAEPGRLAGSEAPSKTEEIPSASGQPGAQVENFEELLSAQEGAVFQHQGRSFVWREGQVFETNPDGSLTVVEAPENLYTTDDYGRKWLSREADGTIYIDLAPKIWASINFAHNSDEIDESSRPILDAFGLSLNSPALINHRLVIGGHTNNLGRPQYNIKLSQRRALSVSRYLIDRHHIDPGRLILHGYGDTRPVADNNTEEGLEQNRRVEFILLGPDGGENEESAE